MPQDASRPEFWETRYRDGVTPWDSGGVPPRFNVWAGSLAPGTRVLVPGCGSGHELRLLAEAGADVLAIDFSPAAVALARQSLGRHAHRVMQADFFSFDIGSGFQAVYERAFLCALPRRLWGDYALRMAQMLRPGGELSGFFFFDDNERGPPFGASHEALDALLNPAFRRELDEAVTGSLPVFEGKERWQCWRRRAMEVAGSASGPGARR